MNKHVHPSSILAICTLGLIAPCAMAQTPPDAGALQQQIDRERQQQLPKRITPDKPAAPAAMKPASGVIVTVKQFRFAGNTLMTGEQLAPAVADYLNRPLDFNQLNAAAAAIAELYRAAGWVVRAYLPQQDIKDGIVTIQIVEAVFGKLKLEQASPTRVSPRQIEGIFAARQRNGEILNNTGIDRALLLADDLPGVTVAGSLVPGVNDRETDLMIKMADEPLFIGEAAVDNTGARSTGSNRLTANLNVNSPFRLGDLIGANLLHTDGSDYLRLAYSLPVGSNGWRIGANASSLNYRLVTSEFQALHSKGTSDSVGLEATYPIIRARLANLYLNLNVDQKKFDNESSGATTTRYTVDLYSIALNGNLFDNLGGGGANSANLAFISGKRNNSVGTADQDISKLRYNLSRQQVITNDVSFYAAVSGQEANKNVDSSEKFYLGGSGGVRAYPSNEAGGDKGTLTSLELRWKLREGFTLAAFHDYGSVRNEAAKSYSLKGAGLSLGWQTPVGLNLKTTWAHRLGNNPNPTSTGTDQDGSLDKNRVWLNASQSF